MRSRALYGAGFSARAIQGMLPGCSPKGRDSLHGLFRDIAGRRHHGISRQELKDVAICQRNRHKLPDIRFKQPSPHQYRSGI